MCAQDTDPPPSDFEQARVIGRALSGRLIN